MSSCKFQSLDLIKARLKSPPLSDPFLKFLCVVIKLSLNFWETVFGERPKHSTERNKMKFKLAEKAKKKKSQQTTNHPNPTPKPIPSLPSKNFKELN